MSSTITSVSLGRRRRPEVATPPVPQLILSLHCDQPTVAPSRHLLPGLDEVRFGRGDAAITRTGTTLALRIADPRMSSDHGRLVRRGEAWHLDDPSSKNGCILNGALTRRGVLGDGDVLELGHTFFVFRVAEAVPGPDDLDADALDAPSAELKTFVGELADAYARLGRVAGTDVPILVSGETGTGKEVVARAVHALSQRKGAFVAVNCGALPETLVEAELFGAKRGAFSGATVDRPGLVRGADGGTLFLDEIAELRPSSQAAFLRVLQEREVLPLGDTRAVKVDVRLCAATHRNLRDMVARGTFRDDLYARLLGFTVELPTLRRRREDLGLIIRALLGRKAGTVSFTPTAARLLHAHDWPHNIREFERALASAVALAAGKPIDAADLPEQVRRGAAAQDGNAGDDSRSIVGSGSAGVDDDALRAKLVALLTTHRGNVAAVARVFHKDRMQIHRWVRRFAIDLEQFRR